MINPDYAGQTIDQYQVERLIGRGSMGSVYLARDRRDQREVVIKIIHAQFAGDKQFRKQFFQQMRAATQLNHTHLVPLRTYDLRDEVLYLVMPYLTGGTLTDYLQQYHQQGDFPPLNDVVEICSQLADALDYAHSRGLVHRNVTPDQVLFTQPPVSASLNCQLSDFGLGQLKTSLTGVIPGLPGSSLTYMAPEQAMGADGDRQIDIYALGVILYEMLVGKPPYQPANLPEVLELFRQDNLILPHQLRPELPEALDTVVANVLATSPGNRYQLGSALTRDLRQIQANLAAVPYKAASQKAAPPVSPPPLVAPAPAPIQPVAAAVKVAVMPPPPRLATITALPDAPPDLTRREILDIIHPRRPRQSIDLVKDVYLIGREPDCDLVIDHRLVSRHHARIERDGRGSYQITDLGTTNGTLLDNLPLVPNVETPWRPPAMVRVGDVLLSIRIESELDDTIPLPPEEPPPVFAGGTPGGGRGSPPAAQPPQPPSLYNPYRPPLNDNPNDRQIDAVLIPRTITLNPGGVGNLILEVINRSPQADHVLIQVLDMSATWLTIPTYSIHLPGGSSESVSLLLHPPRTPESIAGQHSLTLQITGMNNRAQTVVARGEVTITTFKAFSISLYPMQVLNGSVSTVTVYNDGNTELTCAINVRSPEGQLRIEPGTATVTVPPGKTAQAGVWLSLPTSAPGSERGGTVPFEVTVESGDGALWQQLYGSVVLNPRHTRSPAFPLLSFIGLLAVLFSVLICGVFGTAFLLLRNAEAQLQQAAVEATATGEAVVASAATATQDAQEHLDEDFDGLSLVQEIAAGTNPLNPDTDGDGLLDGEDPEPLVARQPDLSEPAVMVLDYYQRVNLRDYTTTFPRLTPAFLVSTGTANFDAYRAWWDSVSQIAIGDIHLISIAVDTQTACVYAELTYNMVDGRQVVDEKTQVYLIRDPLTGNWLIDAKLSS